MSFFIDCGRTLPPCAMAENEEETSPPATREQGEAELAESATREREARRTRRRVERERQRGSAEQRRPKLIHADLVMVNGDWEKRTQSEARTSAHMDMQTETRRIVSTLSRDGAVRTEVFDAVEGVWKSLGYIAFDAPPG